MTDHMERTDFCASSPFREAEKKPSPHLTRDRFCAKKPLYLGCLNNEHVPFVGFDHV